MRILVTGGAGYVGSHVVQALLEAGHEPVVYDNLSTGHVEAVRDAKLIVGDVSDRGRLEQVLKEYTFDGCIHLAADSLVGESMRDPARYFRNNVAGGLALFDSLVQAGVAWIVMSSTAAIYGEPQSIPVLEEHAHQPTNPYGESKLMLERILGWYEKAYGIRHVGLRYFNAAGAHPEGHLGEDHDPETHLIPIVLQVALGQRPCLDIFGTDYQTGDGTAVRDYVHVSDLAAAHVAAVQRLNQGSPSGSYNLGNQRGYSVLEIVDTAREVTGQDIRVRYAPRRPGDPDILVAGADQARTVLGWTPTYDLRQIISSAWAWHSTRPRGYRS